MEKKRPLDVTLSFDPYYGEPDRDGEQGADVLPDGRVHFRIIAKDAKEVVIDQFENIHPLQAVGDGAWEGTFDLGKGFLYFFLNSSVFSFPNELISSFVNISADT